MQVSHGYVTESRPLSALLPEPFRFFQQATHSFILVLISQIRFLFWQQYIYNNLAKITSQNYKSLHYEYIFNFGFFSVPFAPIIKKAMKERCSSLFYLQQRFPDIFHAMHQCITVRDHPKGSYYILIKVSAYIYLLQSLVCTFH